MSFPLSIITVTFNAAKVIDATLESLARQEDKNFEYIVIDGLSTDGTLDKIASYDIVNMSILSERDNGIYDAMNKGLQRAKGKFVLFLNAGDAFHDTKVTERFRRAFEENPGAGVIYGQTVLVDAQRRFIAPRHLTAPENLTFQSFSNGMVVCHQAFFARRDLALPFNLKYRFSADYEWCLHILEKSSYNVYLGKTPVIDYLNEGTTVDNRMASLKERYKIMCHNYGSIPTMLRHVKFLTRSIFRKI